MNLLSTSTFRSGTLNRKRVALGLAGVAIILRMGSDWIFPKGGPLYYQGIQAGLLLLAVLCLWPRLDTVFLTGGRFKSSIREGLLAVPISLVAGLAVSWFLFGGPKWPTLAQAAIVIGNNLFFPMVEELEFRGFFLSWTLERGVSPSLAIWLVAVMHLVAHMHLFWQHNWILAGTTLLLFVWFGSLTVRTRNLWGAFVAHASANIFMFLPTIGSGIDIGRPGK